MVSEIWFPLSRHSTFRLSEFFSRTSLAFTLCKPNSLSFKYPLSVCGVGTSLRVEAFSSTPEDSGLYLFNSKTGKKEKFVPRVPGKVGIYFCGITPYDYSHVGHARVEKFGKIDNKIIQKIEEIVVNI